MRVCDVKVCCDRVQPRIFELTGSDESDLVAWVDELIRLEGRGWPLSRDSYPCLLGLARSRLEIGNADDIPGLVSSYVSAAVGGG